MFKRVALTVCLMGGCIWCLALATRADSAQSVSSAGPFQPVASVESLMHGQVKFFKEIGELVEKPASSHRNEELHEYAEVLAELANVNRYNKDKTDYRDWATQLRDTSLELASEAKKKDTDDTRLKKLHAEMKTVCGACHDAYQ